MRKVFYYTLWVAFCTISFNSYGQFVSINGQYKMDTVNGGYDAACCGRPWYLVTPDTLSTCFLTRVHSSLPEGTSVLCFAPQYLDSSAPSALHLLDSGDVYLTYVGQGDWYENNLCFYTFPWGNPPTSLSDTQVTVAFANATLWSSGGGLHVGDKIYLGHFPANTGFGFMLVSNGWSNTHSFDYLTSNRWHTDSFLTARPWCTMGGSDIFCSHPQLNQVASGNSIDTARHIVELWDSLSGHIIVGMEDRNRGSNWQPDNDFNDVVFYLTGVHSNSFDMTGCPHTLVTCDSNVGSGSGGGLESESLGGLVSRRDFEKIKNGMPLHAKPNYAHTPIFRPGVSATDRITGASASLERFMPSELYVPQSDNVNSSDSVATTPYYSSPTDITQITTAKDVLSVDYVLGDQAKAVGLAITTTNKAYNHTKSICDRFRGATLKSTDTISIQGFHFVLFDMIQPDGTNEYSITFDVGKNMTSPDSLFLQGKWLITEYKGYDSVFNFQVWANNPGATIKLVNQMLNKLQGMASLAQVDNGFTLPQTYIANGKRNMGNLNITITNNTNATSAYILFEESKTEIADIDTLMVPLTLTQGGATNINVPIKDGYQYEGYLYVNGVETDVVYLADGNWSLDYDHTMDSVSTYMPANEPNRVYVDGEYPIYRSVTVKGTESSYMHAYKFLTSGDEPVNLTANKSLKFSASGSRDVTVKLLKNSIDGMAHQYQATVSLSQNTRDYQISFDDFTSDSLAGPINPTDVTAIVFAFDFYGVSTIFSFTAGDIAFSPESVGSINVSQSKSFNITPNPTTGEFVCSFYSETHRTLELAVADMDGRIFYRQTVQANTGKNTVFVTLPNNIPVPNTLMVSLENKQVKYKGAKLTLVK